MARTGCVLSKDILSISGSETMPTDSEDTVVIEKETPSSSNLSSLQQGQTTGMLEAISVPSDEDNTIQGDRYDSQQTKENQSAETISVTPETVVELESQKNDAAENVEKNLQNKRNKNEIPMEASITGNTEELVSKGDTDVCEDMSTHILSSTIKTEAKLAVDKCTEEDGGLNEHNSKESLAVDQCTEENGGLNEQILEAKLAVDEHTEDGALNDYNCRQQLHEETINNLTLVQTVIERQHDGDALLPITDICHSTTGKDAATFNKEVNCQEDIVADACSEFTVMTSPVSVANNVTEQTDGFNPNNIPQQTCEESMDICTESAPVGSHDNQVVNGNDASLLPSMHQESPGHCFQDSALDTCGIELSGEQNVDEEEVARQEMNLQGTSATTMKSEVQQKQKSVKSKRRKKRGKGRQPKRGKGRQPKKATDMNGVTDQDLKRGRGRPKKIVESVTVPDSTGIQTDCSSGVAVINSEAMPSSEPSVTSTSNGATDTVSNGAIDAVSMECSSNCTTAIMHDDEEFVTVKKLKLDDNLITLPSNLVTSTSSDHVGNTACTLLRDDNIVSRPLSTTEPDSVVNMMDVGNSSVTDGKSSSANTNKAMGINRRKCQRPKKRQAMVMKNKRIDSNDDKLEGGGVEVIGDVDHNVTNAAPLVYTTDTIKESTQNKSVSRLHKPLKSVGNDITHEDQYLTEVANTTCIKPEPEALTLSHVPVTKARWV